MERLDFKSNKGCQQSMVGSTPTLFRHPIPASRRHQYSILIPLPRPVRKNRILPARADALPPPGCARTTSESSARLRLARPCPLLPPDLTAVNLLLPPAKGAGSQGASEPTARSCATLFYISTLVCNLRLEIRFFCAHAGAGALDVTARQALSSLRCPNASSLPDSGA